MKCLACQRNLGQRTVGNVTVDCCEGGCGRIWFDRFELQKFDETHEEAGRTLLDVSRADRLSLDPTKRLNCPKCANAIMMRHFFSVKRKAEVDECPACAGFWLDVGELVQIRSLYASEAARKPAAADYFDAIFGDKLAAMHAESEEQAIKPVASPICFASSPQLLPAGQTEMGRLLASR